MINISLKEYLDNKTLFYDKIDYTIIKRSWDILSPYITLPYIIHIVGTNGKGTTGRFIASFLHQKNNTVLHYSSPHIIKFNERIWIDGNNVDDNILEIAHCKLQNILPFDYKEKLTYFEYTTLLSFILSDKKDFLVLEAGLGGEFDATNVVENNLTVVPSIGLDHTQFLGNTIEEIAQTKLRSCNKNYIFGNLIPKNAKKSTKNILEDKHNIILKEYNLKLLFENITLPKYLQENLNLALSVLEYLKIDINNLILPKLFGRFQYLKSNIIIDVGHNPLAANAIYNQLKQEKKKVILIYNSYKDKDYKNVLKILKPIIKEVQLIKIDDNRIIDKILLENTLQLLDIPYKQFENNISKDQLYLVFGSFLVVEQFLLINNCYDL